MADERIYTSGEAPQRRNYAVTGPHLFLGGDRAGKKTDFKGRILYHR